MPVNRFFYEGTLDQDTTIEFDQEEARHIAKVLRLEVGDTLEVFNGKGVLAEGRIEGITKGGVSAHITSCEQVPPPGEIHLWQAYIRPAKLDFVVEKGTELGINHFHFFSADRSEKAALSENQKKRIEYLSVSGCKQSGRLFLPKIEWAAHLSDIPLGFFGDVSPNAPHILTADFSGPLHFINGPESGFTDEEEALLRKNGVIGVSLADAVLRTETAAIAAATLLAARSHIQK